VSNEIKRRKLSTFHAQELSNLVWGFSTVGEKDGQLLELIEEEAVRRGLHEFKSQVIVCDSIQISLSLIWMPCFVSRQYRCAAALCVESEDGTCTSSSKGSRHQVQPSLCRV
jgi:hypothetical protein